MMRFAPGSQMGTSPACALGPRSLWASNTKHYATHMDIICGIAVATVDVVDYYKVVLFNRSYIVSLCAIVRHWGIDVLSLMSFKRIYSITETNTHD